MVVYQVQSVMIWFMCFSLWYMLLKVIKSKINILQENRIFKWLWTLILPVNAGMMIWLLLNKEFFHWYYDVATGKPVDHYSTYGKCMLFCGIALAFNGVSAIVHLLRRRKTVEEDSAA